MNLWKLHFLEEISAKAWIVAHFLSNYLQLARKLFILFCHQYLKLLTVSYIFVYLFQLLPQVVVSLFNIPQSSSQRFFSLFKSIKCFYGFSLGEFYKVKESCDFEIILPKLMVDLIDGLILCLKSLVGTFELLLGFIGAWDVLIHVDLKLFVLLVVVRI